MDSKAKERLTLLLLEAVVGLAGFVMLFWFAGFGVTAAVFLLLWSTNMGSRRTAKEMAKKVLFLSPN